MEFPIFTDPYYQIIIHSYATHVCPGIQFTHFLEGKRIPLDSGDHRKYNSNTCPLESTAVALRTKATSELTGDYVATTLIDEYHARISNEPPSRKSRRGKKKNSAHHQNNSDADDNESDIDSTVRALAAALKSVKNNRNSSKIHCDFCDRDGHTAERCWLNPENPNNKLPQKTKQLFAVQAVKSESDGSASGVSNKSSKKKGKVELLSATVEKTTLSPPDGDLSYADSGATAHCFHSKSSLVPGTLQSCEEVTVLLADKTPVTASFFGDVILPFENANIRLKRVLFIPGLGGR